MGKQQSKPLKPVERNADGSVKAGTPNPGGITKEQRAARDALNRWLCESPQVEAGKTAYLTLLKGNGDTPPNPVIVKDFMDRVAGKVKERLELSEDEERPLIGLTVDRIIAELRGERDGAAE